MRAGKPKTSIYREYDALAYNPRKLGEERGAINHIKKAKQKAKGLEILFDPKGHRDFVTGFRKRKEQRRKEAYKQIDAKEKKQRQEERAERRQKLKADLGLPDNYGVDNSSEGEEDDEAAQLQRADVTVYQQGQLTTTVSVVDLDPDRDSEDAGDGSGDEGEPAATQQLQQQQQQQQQQSHKRQHKQPPKRGIQKKQKGAPGRDAGGKRKQAHGKHKGKAGSGSKGKGRR